MLGATDYGILLTDLDHVTLACNRRFGEIFGVPHLAVVQSGVAQVRAMVRHRIPDMESWSANLREVYADPSRCQEDLLALVGPAAWIRRFTGPVRGNDGEPLARVWTFLDVTAEQRQKGRADALQSIAIFHDEDPAKVYKFAVEAVGRHYGSVCLLSILEGEYLAFRAFGGPPLPVSGVRGNTLGDSLCQFCIAAREPVIIQDARLDPAHAGLLPVRAGFTRYAGVPVTDPQGALIGTLCILDDRSDEVLGDGDVQFLRLVAMKAGAELERERQIGALRQELAATSAHLEIAQRQLVESEKLAVTGTLAASIAHDIRNILSAVRLEIEMGAADPRATLETVRGHLDRFSVLSQRLLSYARPRMKMHGRVDVAECVARVGSLLEGHARTHGVALRLDCPETRAEILGEADQIELAMVNLLLNSVQAMPSGGEVVVRVWEEAATLCVEVADEGVGIPPAMMERLFEPFASTRAEGCGLGLYSCRRIVEDHGGSIQVVSRPGQGTVVTLAFPLP